MSDTNKFINTYVDTIIATLHEYMGSSLQLKTQLKISNDIIAEKDNMILLLNNEIVKIKSESIEQKDFDSIQEKLRLSEETNNALKNKISHMDTLTKQLTDMKNEILNLNTLLNNKENEILNLIKKNETKVTKTKSSNNVEPSVTKVQINNKSITKELPVNDDF